ncbi:unnamed protein product [Moneuplotes crassus]|uniref:Uncharacterized protein n=1 Tax=Euplotes crassus TaxID=5936 RepID=A0AAD1XW75_EUPCR|nr:unnamed protein product [Moneuplotes crassus]
MNSRRDLIQLIQSRTNVINKISKQRNAEHASLIAHQLKNIKNNKHGISTLTKHKSAQGDTISLSTSFHNSIIKFTAGTKLKLSKVGNCANMKQFGSKMLSKTPRNNRDKGRHDHSCYNQEHRVQKAYIVRKQLHKDKSSKINFNKPASDEDLSTLISSSHIATPRTPRGKTCYTPNLKNTRGSMQCLTFRKTQVRKLWLQETAFAFERTQTGLERQLNAERKKKSWKSRNCNKYSPMFIHTVYGDQEAESRVVKTNNFVASRTRNPAKTQYSCGRITEVSSKDLNAKEPSTPCQNKITLKMKEKNLILKNPASRKARLNHHMKENKQEDKFEMTINKEVDIHFSPF